VTSLYNRAPLLLAFTALFWAGNVVVGRAVAGVVPSVMLVTLRWGIATLILLPFAWQHLKRDWREVRDHLPILIFLSLIGPGCYNTMFYLGLTSTEATNGLVLNAAGPSFIAVAAYILFGDRLTKTEFFGLGLGFLGVILIIAKADLSTLASLHFNPGDLLLMAAMAAWAVYTAFLRKKPKMAWQTFNAVTFAMATIINVPFAFLERSLGYELHFTAGAALAVLYISIFPSLIAYVFYARAVDLIGPIRSGIYLFLIPVFGAVMTTFFLGERLALYHVLGFLLVIGGVVVGAKGTPTLEEAPEACAAE
jgi:drug/metabolite transporter (DMT)-like permease